MPLLRPEKQRILELMVERGWSQLLLAGEARVSTGTIENCVGANKHNLCTQTTAKRIAEALGVPVTEVFTRVVRGATPPPLPISGAIVCRSGLPTTLQQHLYGRETELSELDAAWEDPKVNLVNVVGIGGQGKTALVKRWMDQAAPGYRGAEKVFAWSFSGQGRDTPESAADELFAQAWSCFGDPAPMPKNWRRRAEQLADRVCAGRHLLVLDGMEVLQGPPGPSMGRLSAREPLLNLLQRLAAQNPGLCIVTSRAPMTDLAASRDTTVPQIDLGPITEEAGTEFLRKLGAKGSDTDLARAVIGLWGHPLSLALVGHHAADVVAEGKISDWTNARFTEADLRQGSQSKGIIGEYDAWLEDDAQRSVLRLLSLFDSTVDLQLLDIFRRTPPIGRLTAAVSGLSEQDWMEALTGLRRAGLLNMAGAPNGVGVALHPIVRNYFREAVQRDSADDWRSAHGLIYRTLLARAPKEPIAYQDLLPLYRVMRHGFEAGLHEQVFSEVVWQRLLQGYPALALQKYNAGQLDLIAVGAYFTGSPLDPASLHTPFKDPALSGRLYWWAGLVLRLHGRLEEAIPFFEQAKLAYERAGDETSVPMALAYQSSCLLHSGKVRTALECSRQAIGYLESALCDMGQWILHSGYVTGTVRAAMLHVGHITGSTIPLHRRIGLFDHGEVLHAAGLLDQALMAFEQGLKSPLPPGARAWDLFAVLDGYYCELLMELGRHRQVRAYIEKRWPKRGASALTVAIAQTLLGRLDIADLAEATELRARADQLEGNAEHLDYRTLPHLVRGLLELAAQARRTDHLDLAEDLLKRARAAYRSAHLTLFELDCLLEEAWQALERRDDYQAFAHAVNIKATIEADGYHLKEGELERLLARIDSKED